MTTRLDCIPCRRFATADMVVAKGQGNYETLSREPREVFFLFKAKCPVIAEHAGVPLNAHVLLRSLPSFNGGGEECSAAGREGGNEHG